MTKSRKKILIIVSIVIVAVTATFLLLRKKASVAAKAVKDTFPADSPEKFLEYLKKVFDENQLFEFRKSLLAFQRLQVDNPEEYKRWYSGSAKIAQALGTPEDVEFYYSIIYNVLFANEIISKELQEQIAVDARYMYRV